MITKKQLNQLRDMQYELKSLRRRQERYARKYPIGSPQFDSIGGYTGVSNKTCDTAMTIVEIEEEIADMIAKIEKAVLQALQYINNIDDSLTRQIFTARYVDCMTWNKVADTVCGYNSEDSVKKIAYRYWEQHKDI